MRSTRSVALLNSSPWMFDFRNSRRYALPPDLCSLVETLLPLFNEWDSFTSWRHWHARIQYIDYSDEETVRASDAFENWKQHRRETQPALQLTKFLAAEPRVMLSEPKIEANTAADILSTLLHLSFRRQELRTFHKDIVQLKPNPSVGARHGLEVFIRDVSGRHYYDCAAHALCCIDSSAIVRPRTLVTEIYFRPEVYMWRYKSGGCLVDVYMDLGHALGNLVLAGMFLAVRPPTIIGLAGLPGEETSWLTPLLALVYLFDGDGILGPCIDSRN